MGLNRILIVGLLCVAVVGGAFYGGMLFMEDALLGPGPVSQPRMRDSSHDVVPEGHMAGPGPEMPMSAPSFAIQAGQMPSSGRPVGELIAASDDDVAAKGLSVGSTLDVETLPEGYELHSVSGYEAKTNRVRVKVDRPGKDVVLLLTAYEGFQWEVLPTSGTRIARIVVSPRGGPVLCEASPPVTAVPISYSFKTSDANFTRMLADVQDRFGRSRLDSHYGKYALPATVVVNRVVEDSVLTADYPPVGQGAGSFEFTLPGVDGETRWTPQGPMTQSAGPLRVTNPQNVCSTPDGRYRFKVADDAVLYEGRFVSKRAMGKMIREKEKAAFEEKRAELADVGKEQLAVIKKEMQNLYVEMRASKDAQERKGIQKELQNLQGQANAINQEKVNELQQLRQELRQKFASEGKAARRQDALEVLDTTTNTAEYYPLPGNFPEFSWAKGMGYSPEHKLVVVASFGGEGFFYRFDFAKRKWKDYRSLNNQLAIMSMGYDPVSKHFMGVCNHPPGIYEITTDGIPVLIQNPSNTLPGFQRLAMTAMHESPGLVVVPNGREVALVLLDQGKQRHPGMGSGMPGVVSHIWVMNMDTGKGTLTYKNVL